MLTFAFPATCCARTRQYNQVIPQVLNYFHAATVCDSTSFKAWHEWAMMNFRVVKFAARANNASNASNRSSAYSSPTVSPNTSSINGVNPMSRHIVASIDGFFRSIWLQSGGDNSRQDVLRLLALWFEHGHIPEVEKALAAGLFGGSASSSSSSTDRDVQSASKGCISLDTWLAVIPQIIARIHSPSQSIRGLLHELLSRIGRAHPQALVYPLTVASKSYSEVRKAAALSILNQMRLHSNLLVNQALLVSSELVRVAILWHELWHEGIEEASRYWFGQKNVDAMLATLAPLHAMMEKGPQTARETLFAQSFGRELAEAQNCTNQFQKSGRTAVSFLNKAWELYGEWSRNGTNAATEASCI
jgi:FKBP12-rapamycin complex-associated protein